MDVFVIPVGASRYELYCEVADVAPPEQEAPTTGIVGQLRHKFAVMLKAAEERQHRRRAGEELETKGLMGRVQDRCMAWVVERIAEQRLLWHLLFRRRHVGDLAIQLVSARPDRNDKHIHYCDDNTMGPGHDFGLQM